MASRKQRSAGIGSIRDLPGALRGNGLSVACYLPPGHVRDIRRIDVIQECMALRDCARSEYARRAGFVLPQGSVARARDASPAIRRAAVNLARELEV